MDLLTTSLSSERPGDVRIAWEALQQRGRGWVRRVTAGLRALDGIDPDAAAAARRLFKAG